MSCEVQDRPIQPETSTLYSFTDRNALRDTLVGGARDDQRITSAAVTASAALGDGDSWSDVDLAFGVVFGQDRGQLIADGTTCMYREHGSAHNTEVVAGIALFQIFLLGNTLQVDVAFWSEAEFGIAATFRLLLGTTIE